MKPKTEVTQSLLKSLFSYDASNGLFTRLRSVSPNAKVGDVAGCVGADGYRRIWIFGKYYSAHRLAFLYMTGRLPTHDIDHMDGVKDNNSWRNLRDVPESHNMQNQRKPHRNNKLGVLGVSKCKSSKFSSRIRISGKDTHLGTFETAEKAREAYMRAKQIHHQGALL